MVQLFVPDDLFSRKERGERAGRGKGERKQREGAAAEEWSQGHKMCVAKAERTHFPSISV